MPVLLRIPVFLPEILMDRVAMGRSILTIMPVFRTGIPLPGLPATAMDATVMEKPANRLGKRAAARARALARRAAVWQRQARRAVTLMLIAASVAEMPARVGHAQIGQVGQGAMAPAGGVLGQGVSQAAARLGDLEENGPGWMYYGINAADRGLGYRGSYFTVGGFVPYAEDDMGGLWSADLRSHLSTYGGFFSNVGLVRKQFVAGSILGLGVYWDYDGDQNQYSNTTISDTSGSYVFSGGQTYQQVGVSAEFLTDYGNLRSNGYMPCGNTAQLMGPFVGNSKLCQNGINAALTGADLELGAYVPGLSDWAGMVSVGGYAFGNARYNTANGQDIVPYFGGVYTRLDMTVIRNWDFSLQANNDSYFDWTGFARITYRMGGSRRRNVPEQMEQPMMRNEHVVRAHQAPEQAINPFTGTPWRVIHVDNSYSLATATTPATTTNAGTYENPVTTLSAAELRAQQAFDIVFVAQGNSLNTPYAGGFTFQRDYQYLVGQGSSLQVPTANCGMTSIWANGGSAGYPVIGNTLPTSTADAAVVLTNGAANYTTVDHIQIKGAQIGISDGVGLPVGGVATVNDVRITGNGPGQTGVLISDQAGSGGTVDFTKMQLNNLTAEGFVVDGQGVGNPFVNISNSTIKNTSGSALLVNAIAGDGRVRLANGIIDGATGPGVTVSGGNAIIETTVIKNTGNYGVSVAGASVIAGVSTTGTSTVQVANSTIDSNIGVQASAPGVGDLVNITINGNRISSQGGGNGVNLAVADGMINANVVSNRINGTPTTTSGTSTTTTTGSSAVSNIFLTTSGTSLTNLTIKAANQDNLQAINNNASIGQQPVLSGTAPPPPPNYNPSVIVPLPTP